VVEEVPDVSEVCAVVVDELADVFEVWKVVDVRSTTIVVVLMISTGIVVE